MDRAEFIAKYLGDARYAEKHRFPRWNTMPTVLDEPRLFPRVFPELTKHDHERLAHQKLTQYKHWRALHQEAVREAERRYGADGPLISGGLREHWPSSEKDRVRRLAHASSLFHSAADAHARAARLRSVRRDAPSSRRRRSLRGASDRARRGGR